MEGHGLAEKTDLATRDLAPLIGTAVLADKKALLGGEHAGVIRELLERRGVLAFPQIHFTDAAQIAFTAALGTLGDTVMRNNTGAMHRTKLQGEEPFA